MKLTKSDLAKAVSNQTGIPVSQMMRVIDVMTASISRALASGEEIRISRFGKFHLKTRQGRSVRHPRSGSKIVIQSHRTVCFTGYPHLKDRINGAQAPAADPAGTQERRAETRLQIVQQATAVVRISGIPVCSFAVKDISGNGTSILVPNDSVVLRNLQVGQVIEIYLSLPDGSRRSTMQRSRIAHITPLNDANPHPAGHILVGLQVIDTI